MRGALGGLSPRLRGNVGVLAYIAALSGSIPALAGERIHPDSPALSARVYPRACGGTIYQQLRLIFVAGLSPRLRGNVRELEIPPLCVGSIPALAGERDL